MKVNRFQDRLVPGPEPETGLGTDLFYVMGKKSNACTKSFVGLVVILSCLRVQDHDSILNGRKNIFSFMEEALELKSETVLPKTGIG